MEYNQSFRNTLPKLYYIGSSESGLKSLNVRSHIRAL